jgi:hypothetical protein
VTLPALPRSGEGTIGRGSARVLTAAFLTLVIVPAIWQAVDPTATSLLDAFPADRRADGFREHSNTSKPGSIANPLLPGPCACRTEPPCSGCSARLPKKRA